MAHEAKVDNRILLLVWHLIDTSRDSNYTLEEFSLAIAFLYGWCCRDTSETFKKAILALAEIGTSCLHDGHLPERPK